MSDRSIIKLEQSTEAGIRRLRELPHEREASTQIGEDGAPRESAETVLRRARARAEALVAEAQEEAEMLRKEAERRGYETGLRRGRREAAEELQRLSRRLRDDWEESRDGLLRRLDVLGERLVDIIVRACEKVLERELADETVAAERVRQCLGRFSDISDITLIVSPTDVGDMLGRREKLEEEIPPRTQLLITTDAALGPGEFRIRGDEGVFEGTVADLTASLRRHCQGTLMGAEDEA